MADNFVSWGDYMKLNGDQEQALLDNAMWSANNSQQGAEAALRRAGEEATEAQRNEAHLNGVAKTTLSGTASYRDYLRLKAQAEQQFAAAQMGPNRNSSLVRQQLAQKAGVNTEWTKRGDALEARAAQMAQAASEGATGYTRLASEAKARNDAKTEADKARQVADEKSKTDFRNTILNKMKGQWAASDRAADNFWGQNKGAPANLTVLGTQSMTGHVGQEDNERLAQMGRASGLGKETNMYEDEANYVFGKRYDGGL